MIVRLMLSLVIALLCAGTVQAGDIEDANAALIGKDYKTALKKYKSESAKNNANAQFQIGNIYNEGLGVAQDYAEAVRWYKLAAAQGNVLAQYNLGNSNARGEGVAQDFITAHMWFNLAAISGDIDAVKNRDLIASMLTPQQIAEAQKLARECQARNFKNCD